jgi:hypothetical protein
LLSRPSAGRQGFTPLANLSERLLGRLSFKAKAGVFTRLCRKAQDGNLPAVLVIDEINRGNLPKLLGELVYALEYRGHEVRLPFDDGRSDLIVPENLYVIATMNSAGTNSTSTCASREHCAVSSSCPFGTPMEIDASCWTTSSGSLSLPATGVCAWPSSRSTYSSRSET